MPDAFVVDASPLILLARVDRLDLLSASAASVVVPRSVIVELEAGGSRDHAAASVRACGAIRVIDDDELPDAISSWDLGAGESQVLRYALSHPEAEAIIDDRAARRCAAALQIAVVGTLGLVLRAKLRGHIAAARPVVSELCKSGLRLAPGMMDSALAKVGE